jgi:hypothetical protein
MRETPVHASFIGFTGTPIEPTDETIAAVFGDYDDIPRHALAPWRARGDFHPRHGVRRARLGRVSTQADHRARGDSMLGGAAGGVHASPHALAA